MIVPTPVASSSPNLCDLLLLRSRSNRTTVALLIDTVEKQSANKDADDDNVALDPISFVYLCIVKGGVLTQEELDQTLERLCQTCDQGADSLEGRADDTEDGVDDRLENGEDGGDGSGDCAEDGGDEVSEGVDEGRHLV